MRYFLLFNAIRSLHGNGWYNGFTCCYHLYNLHHLFGNVSSICYLEINTNKSKSIPSQPTPTISLILLLIILGLPGLLIVLTSRRLAYVGWMLIYLLSLPIWNAILPAYSFWHFDDFSWGATRQIEGEKEGESHGDKEGLERI